MRESWDNLNSEIFSEVYLLQTTRKSVMRFGLDSAHWESSSPSWKMAADLAQCEDISGGERTQSTQYVIIY